jgi:hypothetical protein
MYEELVRQLRTCIDENIPCENAGCGYKPFGNEDCIDQLMRRAADAIEELQQTVEHYKGCSDDWYKEACNYKAMLPRWIPVTVEPPLKVGDDGYNGYLVYANGYYEVADYAVDKYDNVPYFHVDGELETDVTHWMLLPEPPKEENK